MASNRTLTLLPEIFQTSTNRQVLSASLDQLTQEPAIKRIQGFVGRRVGPGVNTNDRYVAESTNTRNDYQLEPAVVMLDPDTNNIRDSITYPGILDALSLQGADTSRADRLFTSEYYTWDPFVDFDKFVNFSQYYWLPGGPDSATVTSQEIPLERTYTVTRESNGYRFTGVQGLNPTITLARNGNYRFRVSQNTKETVNLRVSNEGTDYYVIDYQNNPTLTFVRGNTYVLNLVLRGPYPVYIKTAPTLGTTNVYQARLPDGTEAVINNGSVEGTITVQVPQDAPNTLYYVNPFYPNLRGTINVVDAVPGSGPGFWIQTDPGIEGRLPYSPNISSRGVLGVGNNGEDLGDVTFNVPNVLAQSSFYSLLYVGAQTTPYYVNLLTDLSYSDIDGQELSAFLANNPSGIDGITSLDGLSIVLKSTDPFIVWQIRYETIGSITYLRLDPLASVASLERFTINYGAEWSNRSFYRTAEDVLTEIPLLTAVKDVLYYQDSQNPEIFGEIRIIDLASSNELDVDEIIGRKNYTSPNGVIFTNGLKVQFLDDATPAKYRNNEYYVEGVGTGIKLLPVLDFVTPEPYTQSLGIPYDSDPYDSSPYDAALNQPIVPDYLTMNRASPDLNAWARSNRWFHIDVINASAEYNAVVPTVNNLQRARRPILEYRPGLRLFNAGTFAKAPINVIDFTTRDAFSTVNGSLGFGVDGYTFINGTRVIFAADDDPNVRNRIYQVEFIEPDYVGDGSSIPQPIINLTPATDADPQLDDMLVCLNGLTLQGVTFYFDGATWQRAQEKTSVNQPPKFDVYDSQGVSLGNRVKYPSSDFVGSKLFSYAVGTGVKDPVLGVALRYLTLTNVGDIVFQNNLYDDTFTYTKNNVSSQEPISQGYVKQYQTRTAFEKYIGWQTAIVPSRARQQFRFKYDGRPLQLDVAIQEDQPIPGLQVYVGSRFLEPSKYTYTVTNDSTVIRPLVTIAPDEIIYVTALSEQASKVAFYQVPVNLENNPFNGNSSQFTLGTIRSHYETIGQNLKNIQGPIIGANNTRDLGDIIPYGANILQQSAPLTLPAYFMRSQQYNLFNSLVYNSREYEKFKAQLLDAVTTRDYQNMSVPEMLTAIIQDITAGRTENNPFYWSDMLPAGNIFQQLNYTYTAISTPVFDLTTTYNFTSSNYQAVLVYLNGVQLVRGLEYTVDNNVPRLEITVPLAVGDQIIIREYAATYGSFVPNTPTKLGLYPSYEPKLYLDTTYQNPTFVIQGHDGSITVAFGDIRDELLLEFEKRIYNNLKIHSEIPLPVEDVVPGQFRKTDYSLTEINDILVTDFLWWTSWNKLSYSSQAFDANNAFSWNYSASGNRLTSQGSTLTEEPLSIGNWHGIYQFFYDTVDPANTPWRMLGFTNEPSWWQQVYGPAPYTSDNLILWEDLAQGRVADPSGEYFKPEYARPRLLEVIPVDSQGNLRTPFEAVVGLYDSSQFRKSWVFGDWGPTEYAWRRSSAYPYAVMRMLAVTRPAKFFNLFVDRDLYRYNEEYQQYLYQDRYRLDSRQLEIYGNGVSKASYIDWIVDYNQQVGLNSSNDLSASVGALEVRLSYRVGSFADKRYFKIYAEKSSPESLNSSLLLPDESYSLLLYKNQPFDRIVYSSVIVQRVEDGYAVFGYSTSTPYFNILASRTAGPRRIIDAGNTQVQVPSTYSDNVTQVPYGYVFTNKTVVVDFLLSYGEFLTKQGLLFNDRENGRPLNWAQMAQEFLYWSNQGWGPGSMVNLNPAAFSLVIDRPGAIVDNVQAQTPENLLLDQNRTTLPVRDLIVERTGNRFSVTSQSQQTISYLDARFTTYESIIILDNVSVFNDLIYNPLTGARQSRLNIEASVSADWYGQLDAPGFIYNDPSTIKEWDPARKYSKGELVIYKNIYWSAQEIVNPSARFDASKWVKSDFNRIQEGLLPNIPNKANQLADSYDINKANLERDTDLLGYGLIGFRPREYMAALNLSDVTQVNLYQQFLKTKGTPQSIKIIGNARLAKESAEYEVFEVWAIQRGVYGANANRSFVEFRLNQALLEANPSTIQVVQPQESSDADQTILVSDIWRESYNITSTNIFPTTTVPITDTALPSAGYVNFDDVDVTVFSLEANPSIDPALLDQIGIGTIVWAAKSNAYDWNIYRVDSVPAFISQVSSNLNGTSSVNFTRPHNLSVGNILIIRFFDAQIDGIYRVLSVPSITEVNIQLSINNTRRGNGIGFYLNSMRIAQASDLANINYAQDLRPGARAWVDDIGDGRWAVLEKRNVFRPTSNLPVAKTEETSKYGQSVAQAQDNIAALVGSPTYDVEGRVYTYVNDQNNNYIENTPLTLSGTTAAIGYGHDVSFGNQQWSAVGAPASYSSTGYATTVHRELNSNVFEIRQLLLPPDLDFASAEFGYSVAVSRNERWLYIGAPGVNKVYAYGLIDNQAQTKTWTTDGVNVVYSFSGAIRIDNAWPDQIAVSLNNQLLISGVDYTVTGTSIVLTSLPPAGQRLLAIRRNSKQIDSQTFFGLTQDSTTGSGTGAVFTVNNTRGQYTVTLTQVGINYIVGDQLTINGSQVGVDYSGPSSASGANDIVITVTQADSGGITGYTFSGSGVDNNTVFELEPYLYTVDNIYSFVVTVDGVYQRPYVDYTFSNTPGQPITFLNTPAPGATILVTAKNYYTYVDTLTVAGLPGGARFGHSVSTTTDGRQILIGAPFDDNGVALAGATYVFDRSVESYIVTDPDQISYPLPAGFLNPVAVLLNNQYLENTDLSFTGEFSVIGNTVEFESSAQLSVGDTIEIESNIFRKVQKLSANSPFAGAQYGSTVRICDNNCSLYVGSPGDGVLLPNSGSVDRAVNQTRLYGTITSTQQNPTLTAGQTILIDGVAVAVPAIPLNTVVGLANAIVAANIPNVTASASNGYLTISVVDAEAADEFNRLAVLPGLSGTVYQDLGLDTYAWTQTILSPNPTINAKFGTSITVNVGAGTLIIGAPGGTLIEPESFDNDTTYFDDRSTKFITIQDQSGAVYSYDYLSAANESLLNPGRYAFGQQIYDTSVLPLDQWGTSVDYTSGRLLIGAPGSDLNDSAAAYGRVAVLDNVNREPAWTVIRSQKPVVDIKLINTVYTYNLGSPRSQFFDFINPLQGKILGAARSNIDYIGAVDPAAYNRGSVNNNGSFWAEEHIGEIWWDINSVRFIDPNQDDITYASNRWSQLFPGSRVDIYQWVQSPVPPANYTGPGIVFDVNRYTISTRLDEQGVIVTEYYFWVRDIDFIASRAGKTLSTTAIARYIESPRSSGIPYIAPLSASSLAIYNSVDIISAQDTILHVGFDQQLTDDNVHIEYDLITQDQPDDFLSPLLYRKLLDSFCGVNATGARVPDINLSPPERYGVEFRPRQSMFINRFLALKNYLTYVNRVIKDYPISELRGLSLLNSSEPEPTVASGEWDQRLLDIQELGYQNLNSVPLGYRYLIASDSTNDGLWTIYTVILSSQLPGAPRITLLTRVQNYDTRKYWSYINWYKPGYNPLRLPVAEVPTYSLLDSVTVAPGETVKVTANAQGKFEIYQRTLTGWDRVALEDGTIEFSAVLWDYQLGRFGYAVEVYAAQYYDQEPSIETRKIIESINEEIFVGNLAIERNRALILVFEYILTEFNAPEWLMKTSLIDVEHRIRQLEPYQVYRQDNQTFVLDYIQEVKPYHVQVRQFNLTYNGQDVYDGEVTDFDNPAYYRKDLEVPQYVSPILLPYTKGSGTGTGQASTIADTEPDAQIWLEHPWKDWYQNYLLTVSEVVVIDGGAGYSVAPQVTVTGDCIEPAVLEAKINTAGQIVAVNVIDPGVGYSTTAQLTFVGGNGLGARAKAVMVNGLVRSIKTTIKFDRYQFVSDITPWQELEAYSSGTKVRYLDQVWQATSAVPALADFDPTYWTTVAAGSLSGIDRTQGYYTPRANEPGLDLAQLVEGVVFPGVQVQDLAYSQGAGFGVGRFDVGPFDVTNSSDLAFIDAIYESSYLDTALGTRPADVNVSGGEYIDAYNCYAPEELVNCSVYDTLDFKVILRPGSDWELNGHGFLEGTIIQILNTASPVFDFSDLVVYPVEVLLTNRNTGLILNQDVDYTVDWVAKTVTMITGSDGDEIEITATSLGGSNQLARRAVRGDQASGGIYFPVAFNQVWTFAVFVNGNPITTFGISEQGNGTLLTLSSTYTANDWIAAVALGKTTVGTSQIEYSWSVPVVEYFVGNGGTTYTPANSLAYTNPMNMIVTVNGQRVRTAAGREHIGDGTTVTFEVAEDLGFSQALIANNEIFVYVDDVPQIQSVAYIVNPFVGSTRTITFATAPANQAKIYIGVTTNTACRIVSGTDLYFDPAVIALPTAADTIAVTTFNDTRQQDLSTIAKVAPFAGGNRIDLGRVITDPQRLTVTLDGISLFYGQDFSLDGSDLVFPTTPSAGQLVQITMMTNSTVPDAMSYRIFQDMNGLQQTYRITPASTTELAQPLSATADQVDLVDASVASEPNIANNVWGVIMVGAERIQYRSRDLINNRVTGLLRGTGGTAVSAHDLGTVVTDISRANLLPAEYQNKTVSTPSYGDGTTTLFSAPNINLSAEDSTIVDEAVQVYVGGILVTSGYTVLTDDPVSVLFDTAPADGREVLISVLQGRSWYQPGPTTPSDGRPLQETNTVAARFMRGE